MPIRFRCTSCNHLMGISLKKAGATVRCPACGADVKVPRPSSKKLKQRSPTARPAAAGPVLAAPARPSTRAAQGSLIAYGLTAFLILLLAFVAGYQIGLTLGGICTCDTGDLLQ
jgi:hypothetical protein